MKKRLTFIALTLSTAAALLIGATYSTERQAEDSIRQALNDYLFEGLRTSNRQLLDQIVHPTYSLHNVSRDRLVRYDRSDFYSWLSGEEDSETRYEIMSIDITGPTAAVKTREDGGDHYWIDYLHMVRLEGQWWIIGKLAHQVRKDPSRAEPMAGSPQDVEELITLLESGSYPAAARLASDLMAVVPPDPYTRGICGLALLKAGRIDEAETVLNQVLQRSAANAEAHLGLGRIAQIRNDPATAIGHLRQGVASERFYAEALRQLWRATWEQGDVAELHVIRRLAEERYGLKSQPLPSWLTNGSAWLENCTGERLFDLQGGHGRTTVPLLGDRNGRIRRIDLTLNARGEYPFDIDSASADFLTLSPRLAEELNLRLTGRSEAEGVGTDEAAVRFSFLESVELGEITFRNVPVFVSDLAVFQEQKRGLIGTALLKRFNVTIDVEAGVVILYGLEQPGPLHRSIDADAVAADLPLYVYDQTVVEASIAGTPPALYILDSAASTHLMDTLFFREHLSPSLDPDRIVTSGIRGSQGAQETRRVSGLPVSLGPLEIAGQTVHEFPMDSLNMIRGRYTAGLLGNPVLWPYRVHLDFSAGRLILERYSASGAGATALERHPDRKPGGFCNSAVVFMLWLLPGRRWTR